MLSYHIDEAEELLSSKLKTAKTSLSNCEEDLDFLREQITVCHSKFMSWEILASDTLGRLWKLLLREYIIGRLPRNVKIRPRRKRVETSLSKFLMLPTIDGGIWSKQQKKYQFIYTASCLELETYNVLWKFQFKRAHLKRRILIGLVNLCAGHSTLYYG